MATSTSTQQGSPRLVQDILDSMMSQVIMANGQHRPWTPVELASQKQYNHIMSLVGSEKRHPAS